MYECANFPIVESANGFLFIRASNRFKDDNQPENGIEREDPHHDTVDDLALQKRAGPGEGSDGVHHDRERQEQLRNHEAVHKLLPLRADHQLRGRGGGEELSALPDRKSVV